MGSSQVESLRFGFILRDRNQNAVVFQKDLKPPVKNHHELFKSHVSDESSENLVDSWIESDSKKNNNKNSTAKPIVRTPTSPVESKSNDNLGASSLVQIWEARLNRSNGGNSPRSVQSTVSSSRSDSGVNVQDSQSSETPLIDGDSELANENADRTVEIEPHSHGLAFDSGESKWGRVADLVRRLSNEEKNLNARNNSGSCGGDGVAIIRTQRPYTSLSSKKSSFPVVNFSPRIRGRQAFTDRHRELDLLLERNAVSRFAQRGRLQSMLRLRNLNRCLAIQDRTRSNAKTTGLNRIEPGSTVLHLREIFRAKALNAVAATDKKDHHRSTEMNNKTVEETDGTTAARLKNSGIITLEAFFGERLNICNPKLEVVTLCKEEKTVSVRVESKTNCLQMQETREAYEVCNNRESEKTRKGVCITKKSWLRQNKIEDKMENCMHDSQTEGVELEQCREKQGIPYLNEWEEQEEYEDEQSYYGEMNNDWLCEISRPRSHWEELRKSRYLEVMNTQREDIRRLLERGTVSDFLESGLREKIDNLMMSRVQTHTNNHSEKWELQQEEEEEEKKESEKKEQLTEVEEYQDDRDDLSRSSSSHMFASSPAGSWSSQDTEDTSTPASSVHDPHSPEMEMISSMRSQIQKLQQEMSLLRDSIKTCLDANARLQQSGHRENTLKRKCCACNETQVEAVLYKCGHMCMCLKCANELQWSGGKCPTCRAQIVDVVRVFFDTRN